MTTLYFGDGLPAAWDFPRIRISPATAEEFLEIQALTDSAVSFWLHASNRERGPREIGPAAQLSIEDMMKPLENPPGELWLLRDMPDGSWKFFRVEFPPVTDRELIGPEPILIGNGLPLSILDRPVVGVRSSREELARAAARSPLKGVFSTDRAHPFFRDIWESRWESRGVELLRPDERLLDGVGELWTVGEQVHRHRFPDL